MNNWQLSFIPLFFIYYLTAMESPLSVLLEDAHDKIQAHMLEKFKTEQQAQELLEASNAMIRQQSTFLNNMYLSAELLALLKVCRQVPLPQLSQWKKEAEGLEVQIARTALDNITYLETMDEILNTSDGEVSHEANLAIRHRYAKSLQAKNKEFDKTKASLQKLFSSDLTALKFQELYSISDLKKQASTLKAEDQYKFFRNYGQYIEEYMQHQFEFFKGVRSIQNALGLIPTHTIPKITSATLEEISSYCALHCMNLNSKFNSELTAFASLQEEQSKLTISTITNTSFLPVWSDDILPLSVAATKALKSCYKFHIQFRLKETLTDIKSNAKASIFYFFSNGDYVTRGLYPTTFFVFALPSHHQIVEQDTQNNKNNECLCYTSNGKYYFIDRRLHQPRAYKVDRVSALSFAQ